MSMHAIRFINTLGLLGITTVLLTGFCLQLTLHELPCPLCLLQRAGFTLLMFGFMLNVLEGSRPRHYAIILFAALFGCAVALRQILLHVIPGTPPYGSAVWHYHYITLGHLSFFLAAYSPVPYCCFCPIQSPHLHPSPSLEAYSRHFAVGSPSPRPPPTPFRRLSSAACTRAHRIPRITGYSAIDRCPAKLRASFVWHEARSRS